MGRRAQRMRRQPFVFTGRVQLVAAAAATAAAPNGCQSMSQLQRSYDSQFSVSYRPNNTYIFSVFISITFRECVSLWLLFLLHLCCKTSACSPLTIQNYPIAYSFLCGVCVCVLVMQGRKTEIQREIHRDKERQTHRELYSMYSIVMLLFSFLHKNYRVRELLIFRSRTYAKQNVRCGIAKNASVIFQFSIQYTILCRMFRVTFSLQFVICVFCVCVCVRKL